MSEGFLLYILYQMLIICGILLVGIIIIALWFIFYAGLKTMFNIK